MTIAQAAIKYTKERNTQKIMDLLDYLSEKGDPTHLPLICDINRVGIEGHRWAWRVLEDWRNE